MNNYFELSAQQQKAVLVQTANTTGLSVQAVEKDLWVTVVLQLVFSLPIANRIVFKGGTSLSKVWRVIKRFSEDIDLAIDPSIWGFGEALTKKQIKKLRKISSIFVRDELCRSLQETFAASGMDKWLRLEAEGDGKGDNTYPEPRVIHISYKSLFDEDLPYLRSEVKLEVGSRYELFSSQTTREAIRKSRHLYDLAQMMNSDIAVRAIANDELWNAIHHHRELFTSVSGVDYTPDIRKRIRLLPPSDVIDNWRKDYNEMRESMIYGEKPTFEELMTKMKELEDEFHNC